jgi:hypothetical protein
LVETVTAFAVLAGAEAVELPVSLAPLELELLPPLELLPQAASNRAATSIGAAAPNAIRLMLTSPGSIAL